MAKSVFVTTRIEFEQRFELDPSEYFRIDLLKIDRKAHVDSVYLYACKSNDNPTYSVLSYNGRYIGKNNRPLREYHTSMLSNSKLPYDLGKDLAKKFQLSIEERFGYTDFAPEAASYLMFTFVEDDSRIGE